MNNSDIRVDIKSKTSSKSTLLSGQMPTTGTDRKRLLGGKQTAALDKPLAQRNSAITIQTSSASRVAGEKGLRVDTQATIHDTVELPLPSPALSAAISPAMNACPTQPGNYITPPVSRTPSPDVLMKEENHEQMTDDGPSNRHQASSSVARPRKRWRKPILPRRSLRSNNRTPGVVFKFRVDELETPTDIGAAALINVIKQPEDFLGDDADKTEELSRHTQDYLPTSADSSYLAEKSIRRHRRHRRFRSHEGPILDQFDEELLVSLGIDGFPTSEQFFSSFARSPAKRTRPAADALGFRSIGARRFRTPSFFRGSSDEEDSDDSAESFDECDSFFDQLPKRKRRMAGPRKPRTTTARLASGDKNCTSCNTNQTPIWREVKEQWGDGWEDVILCNACGLQWRMAGLRCANCSYVPRASEKREKQCPRCQTGHWKKQ